MKKTFFFLLVIVHLGIWMVFLFNQYGIGPAWAEDAEKASTAEVKKSTGTIKILDKKPKGMSDIEWEKMKAKRPLPFDKGPDKIDISKYPEEMQDIYKNVFRKKCSKCHTIARPINAPYALPQEWKKYIKKMMKKPGSAINPIAAKKIYKFLVYDSSIRKKDSIEKKLKAREEKEKNKGKGKRKRKR